MLYHRPKTLLDYHVQPKHKWTTTSKTLWPHQRAPRPSNIYIYGLIYPYPHKTLCTNTTLHDTPGTPGPKSTPAHRDPKVTPTHRAQGSNRHTGPKITGHPSDLHIWTTQTHLALLVHITNNCTGTNKMYQLKFEPNTCTDSLKLKSEGIRL